MNSDESAGMGNPKFNIKQWYGMFHQIEKEQNIKPKRLFLGYIFEQRTMDDGSETMRKTMDTKRM